MQYKLNKEQFRQWQQYAMEIEDKLYEDKAGFINEYEDDNSFSVRFYDCIVSQEVLDFFEKTLDLLPTGE
tara:strand:+ start:1855 stop:2064 length:210 start_codon:yes stop_codon:yes gene_type:complete